MGEGKLTPITTPTPLNRQSRNIAHMITSTISPYTRHLVKIAAGVTFPHTAKVTTHFLKFLSLYAKSFYRPRAQAIEPILTRDRSTDAYSNPLLGVRTQNFHIFTLKTPKTPIFGHIQWKAHGKYIFARCIEIRRSNLARCFTLPSTWSIRKSFSVWCTAGA